MNEEILDRLPYTSSFRFVDTILSLDTDAVSGTFHLKKDAWFYEDHFVGFPVTPGVIITEIMAQIGLVLLGLFLTPPATALGLAPQYKQFPLLTATDVSFHKMLLPGSRVTVTSKKQYFRFGKLKCYIEMVDETGDLVAKGMFSGMISNPFKYAAP